tara:strand:+ start:310 stop:438 length:129 start_codon:yes stop_codon:yes gene_type:complete
VEGMLTPIKLRRKINLNISAATWRKLVKDDWRLLGQQINDDG